MEGVPVIVQCIIHRTYPENAVSARWTYISEEEDAGTPDSAQNEDGSYKLTYDTELTFDRTNHEDTLTCHSVWEGNDDYANDSI